MKKIFLLGLIILFNSQVFANVNLSSVLLQLDGHHLTLEDLIQVARYKRPISIDRRALQLVQESHRVLLLAGQKDFPIYGLNRGVGLNKDKIIFQGDILDNKSKAASEKFNINVLHAHSAGFGPAAPSEFVRAAMLTRLNTLLLGNAGVQPDVVRLYVEFLNQDIVPILPYNGSIGEADITILSHIGLAMIGEGEVWYKGKKMPAKTALAKANLQPLQPFAKDALSILSSNAFTAGVAAIQIYDAEQLINKYELVSALSLEGINGNIAPLLSTVHAIRPYTGQGDSAQHYRNSLQGSYLGQVSSKRALQDPLSFRTLSQLNGAARDILSTLEQQLVLQLNSSDDNPAVIVGIQPNENATEQEKAYYLKKDDLLGAVIPTANFDPVPWVINLEALQIALSHLSVSSVQRISRLESDCFTRLSRFLAPDQTTIAFGAIQKPVMFLNSEIQQLSLPISSTAFPVAGDIEDTATNSLLITQHLRKIIDNLYYILGIELIHNTQAIDLRRQEMPDLVLGKETALLHQKFRDVVKFLKQDRVLTDYINNAYNFIRKY